MSNMAITGRRVSDVVAEARAALGASLRPYQAEGLESIESKVLAGRRRILYVLPPAGGKTIVAVMFILGRVLDGQKVLFVAHRRSLVMQAASALIGSGLPYDLLRIETGEHTAGDAGAAVTVASVQALRSRGVGEYDVVIVDEAHRCASPIYSEIVRKSGKAVVLGLTGTPWRLDGKDLTEHFDNYVPGPQSAELATMGYISMPEVLSRPLPMLPNMSGAKIVGGDYAKSDLRRAVMKKVLIEDMVNTWISRAEGRPTILFAAGIAHSKAVREEFERRGVICSHVDGTMSSAERQAAAADVRAGKSAVLCNSDVMAEGVDIPPVRCVIMARPLTSTTLYLQQVARCMRLLEGAASALVLDHAGNVHLHGLPDEERDFLPTKEVRRRRMPPRELVLCSGCGRVVRAGTRCSCPPERAAARDILTSPAERSVHRVHRSKRVEGLVRAREEAGLRTVLAASRATGFSYSRLVGLETGRQSPWSEKGGCWTEDARKLADAYGLPPEELWNGKDEPPGLQVRRDLAEQDMRPGWDEPHSILFTDAEEVREAMRRMRRMRPMLTSVLDIMSDPPKGGLHAAISAAARGLPADKDALSILTSSNPRGRTYVVRWKAVEAFHESMKEIRSEAAWKGPHYVRRTPEWWKKGATFWDPLKNVRARVTDAHALRASGTSTERPVFLDYEDLCRLVEVRDAEMLRIIRAKGRIEKALPTAAAIAGLAGAGTLLPEAAEVRHARFKVGIACSACGLRSGVPLGLEELERGLETGPADPVFLETLLTASAKAGMERECLGGRNDATSAPERTIWTHGITHCQQFGTKFLLTT